MATVPESHDNDHSSRLTRLETQFAFIAESLREIRTDNETRLRQLERWKYALPASALATALAAAVAIFGR